MISGATSSVIKALDFTKKSTEDTTKMFEVEEIDIASTYTLQVDHPHGIRVDSTTSSLGNPFEESKFFESSIAHSSRVQSQISAQYRELDSFNDDVN